MSSPSIFLPSGQGAEPVADFRCTGSGMLSNQIEAIGLAIDRDQAVCSDFCRLFWGLYGWKADLVNAHHAGSSKRLLTGKRQAVTDTPVTGFRWRVTKIYHKQLPSKKAKPRASWWVFDHRSSQLNR